MERIAVKGTAFTDTQGRERIFNGVNFCDKGRYDEEKKKRCYDLPLVEEETIKYLAEKGFNIVRLGMTWDAVEPEPGKYNDEFLDGVRRIMDMCEKYSIYVYLDMHQDLYSAFTGQYGDGAPLWACLSDGHKVKPTKIVWAEGYFWGKAIHACFDNFWTNKEYNGKGLLDYFADMWAYVAQRLGDHPALFGFDMLNEPFPGKDGGRVFKKLIAGLVKATLFDKRIKKGKLIKDALKLDIPAVLDQYNGGVLRDIAANAEELIAKFDRERYTPFLNKTAAAIRTATDNGIMFIDQCYYSNLSVPCLAGPITYGDKIETQACFSPHGYDFMVDTPLYKHASSSRTDAIFGEPEKVQSRLNVPVMVGEWGGYSEGNEWYPHVHHLLKFFDDRKWSNCYWAFHGGMLGDPLMDELNRPYPRAVTGEITAFCHDRKANTFTLSYEQKAQFDCETVVYLPTQPAEITASGEYEIKPLEFGGFELRVKSPIGTNKIECRF